METIRVEAPRSPILVIPGETSMEVLPVEDSEALAEEVSAEAEQAADGNFFHIRYNISDIFTFYFISVRIEFI